MVRCGWLGGYHGCAVACSRDGLLVFESIFFDVSQVSISLQTARLKNFPRTRILPATQTTR